jgi:hypothetical protein
MWKVRLAVTAVLMTVVAVCVAVLLLAILYLPPWAWLVIAAAVILPPILIRFLVRWKVRSFLQELNEETPPGMPQGFTALFKLKGSVLRKARVTVHTVEPTLPPPSQRESADGEGTPPVPRTYFRLEVTVKPTRWGLGFKRWQPGELGLTDPAAGWMDVDDTCTIVSLEVVNPRNSGARDDSSYLGAQRLRLVVGVREGVERLTFRYYTEKFGEIVLPPAQRLPSP